MTVFITASQSCLQDCTLNTFRFPIMQWQHKLTAKRSGKCYIVAARLLTATPVEHKFKVSRKRWERGSRRLAEAAVIITPTLLLQAD